MPLCTNAKTFKYQKEKFRGIASAECAHETRPRRFHEVTTGAQTVGT